MGWPWAAHPTSAGAASPKRANAATHMLPLFFLVGAAACEVPQHVYNLLAVRFDKEVDVILADRLV